MIYKYKTLTVGACYPTNRMLPKYEPTFSTAPSGMREKKDPPPIPPALSRRVQFRCLTFYLAGVESRKEWPVNDRGERLKEKSRGGEGVKQAPHAWRRVETVAPRLFEFRQGDVLPAPPPSPPSPPPLSPK